MIRPTTLTYPGTAVQVTYPQPGVQYTLLGSAGGTDPTTGDIYWGLDLFSRIVDSRWFNTGSSADVDRVKYGYDRGSNRKWRQNPVATAAGEQFDELYHNDGLQRLKDMQRGTLNGTNTGLTSETLAQCWSLDITGNWPGFNESTDGVSWTTVQSRTANAVNEITGITNTVGQAWTNPVYDAAGNMTTITTNIPGPDGWWDLSIDDWFNLSVDDWANLPIAGTTVAYTGAHDAWNRLTYVADMSGTAIQYNQYDPRGFRTNIQTYSSGILEETRDSYFSSEWRCLEERVGGGSAAERQFVWGARYMDDLSLRDRSGERMYALQDANWSVNGILDTSGAVQERYSFSPYGTPMFLTGSFDMRPSSDFAWETLFSGYRYDSSLALSPVRNRVYGAALGSWLNQDPLEYVDSTNLYEYVVSKPTLYTDPSGEIIPLLIIGGLVGANIYLWKNNASAIDDIYNNRPLNPANSPYTINNTTGQVSVDSRYYTGLVKTTALASATAAATPYVASALPAYVTTTGAIGISGYGIYSGGSGAVSDFQRGNYASGSFNVGMAGLSAYGGYQVVRPLAGIPEAGVRNPMSEYCRFREQGYWPRQARDSMTPYVTPGRSSMGHHYIPRRWFNTGFGRYLPRRFRMRMQESPYNVMRPTGISRGRFYERHSLGDRFARGFNFPQSAGGGSWSRSNFMPHGYRTIDYLNSPLYGLPDRTQGVISILLGATGPRPVHRDEDF